MQDIFETVEPSPSNLQTYGHKIRELLLLAAMEVEASWAAVLKANGYAGGRFTTNDYVKLLAPMRLDSFSLTLRSYPDFPGFTPFKDWDTAQPTKSLEWYDAYNKAKHDREQNLGVATLERAVHAVGAAVGISTRPSCGFLTHLSEKAALRSLVFLDPAAFHGTNDPRDTGHVNECIALGGNAFWRSSATVTGLRSTQSSFSFLRPSISLAG